MPRPYRYRADDSLLTLLGDLPELVANLVKAEVNAARTWVGKTSKDAGIGSLWFLVALFFLFWAVPVVLVFGIVGLSSWWPVWLSVIAVFGILILAVLLFGLLGFLRWRRVLSRENPAQAVATDLKIAKGSGHDEL